LSVLETLHSRGNGLGKPGLESVGFFIDLHEEEAILSSSKIMSQAWWLMPAILTTQESGL
jgi:hypothetical protein